MTVDDIILQQAGLLSLDPADITGDPEKLAQFIGYQNQALAEIERAQDWPWLYSRATVDTIAGQDEVSLPADFVKWLPDDVPYLAGQVGLFEYASREKISRLRAVSSTPMSSRPFAWNMAYNAAARRWQMTLWPRPSDVYTITIPYRRRIPRLAAVSDIPSLPDEFHEVLALGACAYTEELEERMDEGTKRAPFNAGLQQLWAEFGSPITTQSRGRLASLQDDDADGPDPGDGPLVLHVTA